MSLLTDKERLSVLDNYQLPKEAYRLCLDIESAVLEKLKAQEPVAWLHKFEKQNGDQETDASVSYAVAKAFCDFGDPVPLYIHPLPPDDVVRDAERLDWLLENTDATVCSDGAYGPFHVWFRYSNRTTEPAKTARAAIDAAMKEMK